jgi:hypothetical protein
MRGKLILAAACCVAALPPTGAAGATSGCGAAVLKDWSDGKLNRTYSIRCYQAALNRMPEDMRSYTTAPDDIQRALLAQVRAGRVHHARSPAEARPAQAARRPASAPANSANRRSDREALPAAGLEPAGSPSLPLPLLALVTIGLVLLTAGSAGVAARKLRS